MKKMVFISNNFKWVANSICDLYKARWTIEVFFKKIKRTLQLADFMGYNKMPFAGKYGQRYWHIFCYALSLGKANGIIRPPDFIVLRGVLMYSVLDIVGQEEAKRGCVLLQSMHIYPNSANTGSNLMKFKTQNGKIQNEKS